MDNVRRDSRRESKLEYKAEGFGVHCQQGREMCALDV